MTSLVCQLCKEPYTGSSVLLTSLNNLATTKNICFKCYINEGVNDIDKNEPTKPLIDDIDSHHIASLDFARIKTTIRIEDLPSYKPNVEDLVCHICGNYGTYIYDDADQLYDNDCQYLSNNKILIRLDSDKNKCIPCLKLQNDKKYHCLSYCGVCGHLFYSDSSHTCDRCDEIVGYCCGRLFHCQSDYCRCKKCYDFICAKCNLNPIDNSTSYVSDGWLDTLPWCDSCKNEYSGLKKLDG